MSPWVLSDALTAMWMRGAVADTANDTLPTFRQLDDPRYFPYRYGHALLAYVPGGGVTRQSRNCCAPPASRAVWSLPSARSSGSRPTRWSRAGTGRRTRPTTPCARQPFRRTSLVRASSRPGGRRQLQRVAVAEPRRIADDAFLRPRALLDRSLPGRCPDRQDRAADHRNRARPPSPESPVHPVGRSWSPDGRRFLFAGLSAGRPVLELYDVASGRVEREVKFRNLGEILNPAWSPDGNQVAFSGNAAD